jgi:hypothetical protein
MNSLDFDFAFLIKCILGITAGIAFLFWLTSRRIGWKDRDRYFNLQRYLLPHEKKEMREYWKKIAITIVAGGVLLLVVCFLHSEGILFPHLL